MLTTGAFAQEYAFKVLANKGGNEVKAGETWQPVKTGASLKATDELKVADNAYLGLVHVSGKPVEIKQSGSYKVSDLASRIQGGTSVVTKYTDFILSSNSAESKKNKLSATGAVHRGETAAIHLLLPENQYAGIFNNIAVISWEGTNVPGPYVITLRNLFDDELGKFETPEKSFKLDLSEARFAKENAINIEVKSKTDSKLSSRQHLVKRLAPTEKENLNKEFLPLSQELKEPTALNKLLEASFYESKGLFIDAITAYEEAIRLAPDVPTYRESYEEFLIRNNIVKK